MTKYLMACVCIFLIAACQSSPRAQIKNTKEVDSTYPSVEGKTYVHELFASEKECEQRRKETGDILNCSEVITFENGKANVMQTDTIIMQDYKQDGRDLVIYADGSTEQTIDMTLTLSEDGSKLTGNEGVEFHQKR